MLTDIYHKVANLFCLAALLLSCASLADTDISECGHAQRMATEDLRADLAKTVLPSTVASVLVGVDALGRIAIALDSDMDGTANRILLFTGQDRFSGPWSKRFDDAIVSIKKGSVLVASRPDSFGLAASVSVADPETLPRWTKNPLVITQGRELVQLFSDEYLSDMGTLDHSIIETWPEPLWHDLLASQQLLSLGGCQRECCEDGSCGTGGMPSSSCSISGCVGNPTGCAVSGCGGTEPNSFACCKCGIDGQGGNASCRCKFCACGPCP